MKKHQLALAVAALAFGAAQAATSTLPAGVQTTVTNAINAGHVISISGASGVQKGFTELIAKLFTGTPTYFSKASASGAGFDKADYVGVAGKLATGTGAWADTDTILVYRVKGGSIYGVNSVARAEAIDALNVTLACGATGTGAAATPYACSTTTLVPDAGVSDIAPALFQAPYNTEGELAAEALSPTELAELTATPLYHIGFGLALTKNVPAAVEINRSTLAAILSGNVTDWSQVKGGGASSDIVVCRRTPGSGTQAVYNMYAGNFPCGDAQAPVDRDASAAWDATTRTFTAANGAGGMIVVENASSSDVVSCLTAAVNGGTYDTKDRDGVVAHVDFGTGGYKALGTVSMDSLAKSTVAGAWQFRPLGGAGTFTWAGGVTTPVASGTSGVYPTLANVVNGSYDMQGVVSFNVPARTTGDKLDVLTKFIANAQNPDVIAVTADLKNVAAAVGGTGYAGANTASVMNAAYLNGNQCAPLNRNYNN